MSKNIIFVINGLPSVSETFISNQIDFAIKQKYFVKIVAGTLHIENNNQNGILKQKDIWRLIDKDGTLHPKLFPRLVIAFKRFIKNRGLKYGLLLFFHVISNETKRFNILPALSVFCKISRLVNSGNGDIFHCQYGPNGVCAAKAKKYGLIKGKIITTFHGYDAHFDPTNLKQGREFYNDLFKITNYITVNTPYLGGQVLKLGCPTGKLRYVPMGVDFEGFRQTPKTTTDPIIFISIGRLISLKGHRFGIEAINILVKKGYNVQYTIIGDGQEKDNLSTLIQKHNLQNHVLLAGSKTQSEVKKYLSHSHIFLMTSTYDIDGRAETQGVVTIEAQAFGLPIVAFRTGGVPYTIKENVTGFTVNDKDINSFSEKCEELIINKQFWLGEKKRKEIRNWARANYSLEITNQQFMALYEK